MDMSLTEDSRSAHKSALIPFVHKSSTYFPSIPNTDHNQDVL